MRKTLAVLAIVLWSATGLASAQTAVTVDGNVGLQSFVSLTDAHMRALLHDLQTFAGTSAARSGAWSAIEAPLVAATGGDVAVTAIYATPQGRYWVAGKGLQPVPIADRPYFAQVFAGKSVVGDLVVGRSSATPVAIIAVPIRSANGGVGGLVGVGVHLPALNAMLAKEMGAGKNVVFWAVDARGITALHSDAANIFNDALKVAELHAALSHMIATDSGDLTYAFKGKLRTVLFRHSALTGWTYGFGVLH